MELKSELKDMIIRELKLKNVSPEDIDDEGPLFGSESKLGLDSLDAVELVVIVQKKYAVDIGDRNTATVAFASINALADYITKNRPAP
ncbi:MAG: acyl carrier protein [Candidatus Aminicenantes bacterium RBG_13_62_12]|nr:MAG: acyl carrier protein [Candidatus Aminicenantes bacterium RBG_13_62_12]